MNGVLERLGQQSENLSFFPVLLWLGVAGFVLALGAWVLSGLWLSIIDIREHRLPKVVISRARSTILVGYLVAFVSWGMPLQLLSVAVGVGVYWGLFALLRRLSRRSLGQGDVHYATLLGSFLGGLGWLHPLYAALAGIVCAGIWGVFLMIFTRAQPTSHLPLGPFMFVGSLLVFFLS